MNIAIHLSLNILKYIPLSVSSITQNWENMFKCSQRSKKWRDVQTKASGNLQVVYLG